MKKFITIILICLITSSAAYSAVKVNLSFGNFRNTTGYWTFDIIATVLPAQVWRVGSSNIRVDWVSFPASAITVRAENPAFNPNPNLHSTTSYGIMTTTSISGGTSESLNIVWNTVGPCYRLNPGIHVLGSMRFNRLDTNACVRLSIRTTSVLQDSLTQLLSPADFTTTLDTHCYVINRFTGINSQNEIPTVFKLYTNYPNPFNPVTTIKYDIPKATEMTISVYDILGKEIDKLVNGYMQPG